MKLLDSLPGMVGIPEPVKVEKKKMGNQVIDTNTAVCGKTGSGKTFFVKNSILPDLYNSKKEYRQVIILDMKNEYDKYFDAEVDIKNLKSVNFLRDIMIGKNKATKGKKPKILKIKADVYTIPQVEIVFEYLCKTKHKILLFEEGAFFFEDLKKMGWPKWTKLFIRARTMKHNGNNNIILVTQAPNDMPKVYFGQFDKLYLFKLKPFQIKYLFQIGMVDQKEYDFSVDYSYYEF